MKMHSVICLRISDKSYCKCTPRLACYVKRKLRLLFVKLSQMIKAIAKESLNVSKFPHSMALLRMHSTPRGLGLHV